jgi:hypothetical protein
VTLAKCSWDLCCTGSTRCLRVCTGGSPEGPHVLLKAMLPGELGCPGPGPFSLACSTPRRREDQCADRTLEVCWIWDASLEALQQNPRSHRLPCVRPCPSPPSLQGPACRPPNQSTRVACAAMSPRQFGLDLCSHTCSHPGSCLVLLLCPVCDTRARLHGA